MIDREMPCICGVCDGLGVEVLVVCLRPDRVTMTGRFFAGLVFVLLAAGDAGAQLDTRSGLRPPSVSGPSQRGNRLRTVGGALTRYGYNAPSARTVFPGGVRDSRLQTGRQDQAYPGYGDENVRGSHGGNNLSAYQKGPARAAPATGLTSSRSPLPRVKPFGKADMYLARSSASGTALRTSVGFPELPLIRPNRGDREELLSRLSDLEAPGQGGDPQESGGTERRMITIRRDRLHDKYVEFLRRGWAAFRDKKFTRAISLFDAAASLAPEEPQGELGKFCSAFMHGKVQLTAKYLAKMLENEEYDLAEVLARFDFRQYFADPADLDRVARSLSGAAIRYEKDLALNAVHAFVEWLRGEREPARLLADRVAVMGPDTPWARLSAAMERAGRLDQLDQKPSSPTTSPASAVP